MVMPNARSTAVHAPRRVCLVTSVLSSGVLKARFSLRPLRSGSVPCVPPSAITCRRSDFADIVRGIVALSIKLLMLFRARRRRCRCGSMQRTGQSASSESAPQANRAMMGIRMGMLRMISRRRGDKLGVQARAEELFEVLPHAVHLLREVGLSLDFRRPARRPSPAEGSSTGADSVAVCADRPGLALYDSSQMMASRTLPSAASSAKSLGIGVARCGRWWMVSTFSRSSMTCPSFDGRDAGRSARARALHVQRPCVARRRPARSNSPVQVIDCRFLSQD